MFVNNVLAPSSSIFSHSISLVMLLSNYYRWLNEVETERQLESDQAPDRVRIEKRQTGPVAKGRVVRSGPQNGRMMAQSRTVTSTMGSVQQA